MTLTRQIKAGTTDVSVVIRIVDSSDGTPETGVVYNTSGIDLEYRREGAASVDITEATLAALTTAHTDGGFLHIGNGYYRLDLPDAACASGASGVLVHGTVTGMVVIGCYIELVAYDPTDTVRLGLTALPNAAADAAGGLPISDTGGLDLDALNTNVSSILTDTGTTLQAELDGIQADTEDIQSRLPAALVGGRIDATVDGTGMESGAIAAIADGVLDEALSGHTTAGTLGKAVADIETDATAILEDTGTTIPATLAALPTTAEVNAEVDTALADIHLDHLLAADYDPASKPGTATALLNELIESDAGVSRFTANALEQAPTGGSAPTAGEIADAVLDEALSGHTTAGTLGKAVADIETDATAILADTNELQTDDVPTLIAALPTAAENRAEMDSNSTQLAAIVADTNELQTDWANGGRLDLLIDAILADTNELQADDYPTTLAAMDAKLDTIDNFLDTEIAAILEDTGTTIPALIDALPTAAEINAEVVDTLNTDTYAEPSSVPAATASIVAKIGWLTLVHRNKMTQTATTLTHFADDGSTSVATRTVSDDGTTATRGEAT